MDLLNCCFKADSVEDPGPPTIDKDAEGKLSHVGKAAYDTLRKQHPAQHHVCWNVTSGEIVGYVCQTPLHGWNREEEYPPEGHDDWFPERMAEVMSRTQVWCDVSSLGAPTGLFLTHMQKAIKKIAENAEGKEQPIYVRIMFGNIIGMPVNCTKVIAALTEQVPKNANIRLWVGAWRKGVSWNHSKIIAVDGKYLFTGGHNLWDYHYLKTCPVHDLSFELRGPVAHDGHRFLNEQWSFIQHKQSTFLGELTDKLPDNMILITETRVTISEFPPGVASEFAPTYQTGMVPHYERFPAQVPLISMGRYGTLLRHARPSDDAFVAMFDAAEKIIRMALQDLGPVCIPGTKTPLPGCVWPKNYLSAFGRAMWLREVDIEIALSNPNSVPGGLPPKEGVYGNGWSCADVASEIIKTIREQFPDAQDHQLRKKVTESLRVCYIREKRGNKYDDGMTMGMHAKHVIVDDVCAFIGSQNLYVCDLAEWGVVVDDKAATEKMMKEYWEPMWKSSFNGEDCNVDEVIDGLDKNRDGEPLAPIGSAKNRSQVAEAQRLQVHANRGMDFCDSSDEEGHQ